MGARTDGWAAGAAAASRVSASTTTAPSVAGAAAAPRASAVGTTAPTARPTTAASSDTRATPRTLRGHGAAPAGHGASPTSLNAAPPRMGGGVA